MPSWPVPLGYKPIDLGLERVVELLSRIGSPQNFLPPVVHFAGTNGKGSTIAFLRAFLESAGYKAHVYTSPHLVNFNERIVLAGAEISDDFLNEVLSECKKNADDIKVTFFEGTTVGAFLAFSKIKADVVLLETGMGGRLDATNVVDAPICTVITPISIDHAGFLGDTIEKIAFEKASIIKKHRPCVVSKQPKEALGVIKDYAKKKSAPLFICGEDFEVKPIEGGFSYISNKLNIDLPLPNLIGDHQLINAGTAIACAEAMDLFKISKDNIKSGVTNAIWHGRMQKLEKGPLVDIAGNNLEVWIDGGHNEAAGEIISKQIDKWSENTHIIAGMLSDKDHAKFLQNVSGKISSLKFVDIKGEEKSKNKKELLDIAENLGIKGACYDDIAGAVRAIKSEENDAGKILICGSLYLVGQVLEENT